MSEAPDPFAPKRFNVAKTIVLTGFALTLGISLILVATSAYLMLQGQTLPEPLVNWSGIALGYVFGSFPALIKDFIN